MTDLVLVPWEVKTTPNGKFGVSKGDGEFIAVVNDKFTATLVSLAPTMVMDIEDSYEVLAKILPINHDLLLNLRATLDKVRGAL